MDIGRETLESSITAFHRIVSCGRFSTGTQPVSLEQTLADIRMHLLELKAQGRRIYLIGNGGSASVAAHICTDMLNVGQMSAQVLHESAQMTCFCNDYGYAHGFEKQIMVMGQEGDLLIAISSSGQSDNIINAVNAARNKKMKVFTLTGFKADNPLRGLGDWNFWLDCQTYGQVEIGHLFLLHHICNQIN